MTQCPLLFKNKSSGILFPEFPIFPHTEDEIYGNTTESQAKTGIFFIKKKNSRKNVIVERRNLYLSL